MPDNFNNFVKIRESVVGLHQQILLLVGTLRPYINYVPRSNLGKSIWKR